MNQHLNFAPRISMQSNEFISLTFFRQGKLLGCSILKPIHRRSDSKDFFVFLLPIKTQSALIVKHKKSSEAQKYSQ